jgi:UDP-3-O-[3-hydroxymyristoyl] N-acetylglucosamine deacetylase
MATIKKEINISGKTLMTGKECSVTFFPSNEHGIRFFVQGCESPILASPFNVVSTDNCVVLGNESSKIMLVEHFMAACAFANINSLDVCLSHYEMPILDGSSLKWVELFKKAGIEETHANESIEIKEPAYYTDNKATIAVLPDEEFKITYCIDFDHPDLKNRWISYNLNQDKMQVIEARTFGYLKDLERFQKMGLALGVSVENTVGLTENGYTTELRSEYEPLKHKILDLIGDLNLLSLNPLNLKAHIIAKDAGHKSHIELAKKLSCHCEKKSDKTIYSSAGCHSERSEESVKQTTRDFTLTWTDSSG